MSDLEKENAELKSFIQRLLDSCDWYPSAIELDGVECRGDLLREEALALVGKTQTKEPS